MRGFPGPWRCDPELRRPHRCPVYRTAQSAFDRNRLMVGIGAALLTEQGLSTRLEYRGITDGDSSNDQTWMINLEKKY